MKIPLRGKILAIFLILIALGCLFFLGWGGYLLFKSIWSAFNELDKQVAVPTVTVSVIAIIIAITLVIGKSIDKKREIKQQQMAQKIDFYKEFLQDWSNILNKINDKSFNKKVEDEIRSFTIKNAWKLILWGSENVIMEYLKFRELRELSDANDKQLGHKLLDQFDLLLFKIRKELGHNDKELGQFDLISLYITDIVTLRSENLEDDK